MLPNSREEHADLLERLNRDALKADETHVSSDGTPAEKRKQLDLLVADPEGFLRRLGVEPTAASRAE